MTSPPDTERCPAPLTPLDRVRQLRRIAEQHAEELADGSFANLDAVGFFVRIADEARRLEARLGEADHG